MMRKTTIGMAIAIGVAVAGAAGAFFDEGFRFAADQNTRNHPQIIHTGDGAAGPDYLILKAVGRILHVFFGS